MVGRISTESIANGRKITMAVAVGVILFFLLLFLSYVAFRMPSAFVFYACVVLWGAFFLGAGFLIHHIALDFLGKLCELKEIWFQEAILSPPFFAKNTVFY